jgi:antirestriction protein ArdC
MTTDKVRELAEQIEATVNALAQETDAARKSESFLRWLTTMAQFHNYSWNNQLLIALQRPSATRVAGFHSWKKLGRNVKKGEKGIAILAPCLYRSTVEEDSEKITVQRLAGFRTVFVFDVAQTEGQELPALITSTAEGGENLLPSLEAATAKLNIVLNYEEPQEPGLQGYSVGGRIVVRKSLCAAAKCAVIVHELAHELLHQNNHKSDAMQKTRAQRELEAEATAYVVMQHYGVQHVAAFYLASYAANGDQLRSALETISSTVKRIISAVEAPASARETSPAEVYAA